MSKCHKNMKNMDLTRECNSLIFELRSMFLSSQMILSFVSAAMVWAILERISGMDPPLQDFLIFC